MILQHLHLLRNYRKTLTRILKMMLILLQRMQLNSQMRNLLFFADAERTGDYSAIYADIKSVVDSYNKLYNTLGKTSSSINTMCSDLLKEAVKENSETLSAVGIALKDDGSLSIDENKLKAADTDTLKKAFGTSSEFAKRLGIIGSNVSSLAKANINYVTNSYTSSGVASNSSDDLYSLMTSKFNSRG